MQHITKAIIPVAGLGTRFLPATKAQPKEMLAIVDKPVIQFLVEEAVASGITEIIFVTGKGKRAIEDHFDSASELEEILRERGKHKLVEEIRAISNLAHFTYVRQKEAKGDGDAILTAAHLIGDEPVAVLFGDDLIWGKEPALKQMMRVYEQYERPILALERVKLSDAHQYGIVRAEPAGERTYTVSELVEKPKAEDAPSDLGVIGKYIITPEVIEELRKVTRREDEELRLAHALDVVARRGGMYGIEPEGERLDCGSKIGFLKATVRFGLEHEETRKEFGEFLKTVK